MSDFEMFHRQQNLRRHLREENTYVRELLEELERIHSESPPPEDEETPPLKLPTLGEVLDASEEVLLERLAKANRDLDAWRREPGRTALEICRAQQVRALIASHVRRLRQR